MREVIRDKGRIEHMLSAINNVEEFTKGFSAWLLYNFSGKSMGNGSK